SLVAANGRVCNGAHASVNTGKTRCAIAQLATLNARDHDGVPLLDGIRVREVRHHNFAGTSK
ncbi:hypothetical protein IXO151_21200, partial [Xanthomonas oryzae pv. oryzae]